MPEETTFFWNRVLLNAACADSKKDLASQEQGGPTRTSRAAAIVHAALHDAVNGVDRENRPYFFKDLAPPTASSPHAAAAAAAHAALSNLYKSQQTDLANFDEELKQFLASLPASPALTPSAEFGARVAKKLVAHRENDGADDTDPSFKCPSGEGKWQPNEALAPPGPPLDPHWGRVDPFIVPPSEVRPPKPPELISNDYTFAYRTVYTKGSDPSPPSEPPPPPANSPGERTEEETQIAVFWSYDDMLGSPIRLYNQHARQILDQEPAIPPVSVLHRRARLFALINIAMADAGIACWESKYRDCYWRPFEGIRADDPNPHTPKNEKWLPLGRPQARDKQGKRVANTTPNFPAYVSGHSSFGTAMFGTLRKFFGEEKEFDFELTSDECPGVIRRYFQEELTLPDGTKTIRKSLQKAIDENSESRIFLGVHWRRDDTMGKPLGQQVIDRIWAGNHLDPIPDHS
jgi:hypothetical protein